MSELNQDMPDIAAALRKAAQSDATLTEALDDYSLACANMADPALSEFERREWCRLRKDLIDELRRLAFRRGLYTAGQDSNTGGRK